MSETLYEVEVEKSATIQIKQFEPESVTIRLKTKAVGAHVEAATAAILKSVNEEIRREVQTLNKRKMAYIDSR